MEGLRELRIDMDYPSRAGLWERKESSFERLEMAVLGPLKAVERERLSVFRVRFEHFQSEAKHWLELPFVEIYGDEEGGERGRMSGNV